MEKEEKKISDRRGVVIFVVVCVIIFLIWELGITVPLFRLGGFRESEVKKIDLMIESSAENADYSDGATITDKKAIKKVIHSLNRMKAYRGFYSVDDLPGQSPSAIITLYDSVDDSDGRSIHIYYDLLLSDGGNYYGVSMESTHRRLAELCETYGEDSEGDE